MTTADFNVILQERQDEMTAVLAHKATEYASSDDRLRDFKLISQMTGISVEDCWKVLHAKHLISTYHLLDGRIPNELFIINEKLGDAVNYMVLAEAILIERKEASNV